MERTSMRERLLVAIALELVYIVFTRTYLAGHSAPGVEFELLKSACRLVTLLAYVLLFADLLSRSPGSVRVLGEAGLLLAVLPALAVPLLFYAGFPADPIHRTVFAGTSLIVAVREEILYRGVLQNLLQARFGPARALALSTLIFVLYHYGAEPFVLPAIVELTSMAFILGLIYQRSGSLLAVITLHFAYDALWSFGPLIAPPDDYWRMPLHLTAALLTWLWYRRSVAASRKYGMSHDPAND